MDEIFSVPIIARSGGTAQRRPRDQRGRHPDPTRSVPTAASFYRADQEVNDVIELIKRADQRGKRRSTLNAQSPRGGDRPSSASIVPGARVVYLADQERDEVSRAVRRVHHRRASGPAQRHALGHATWRASSVPTDPTVVIWPSQDTDA